MRVSEAYPGVLGREECWNGRVFTLVPAWAWEGDIWVLAIITVLEPN